MSYPAPNPVTNLTGTWHLSAQSSQLQPGVALSWTAPVLANGNGTIGGYNVYVLLQNVSTGTIDPVFYKSVRKKATRDATKINAFAINAPETSIFFPFSWVPASKLYSVDPNNFSFSFHVVAFLAEENEEVSTPTGITVYRPNQENQILPAHFNPRFQITSSGDVATFEQDSYEDVASCVEMVVSTLKETRSALPEFGVDDPTFTDVNVNLLKADLTTWEPRAITDVSVNMDDSGLAGDQTGAVEASVSVRIIDIDYTA